MRGTELSLLALASASASASSSIRTGVIDALAEREREAVRAAARVNAATAAEYTGAIYWSPPAPPRPRPPNRAERRAAARRARA